MKRARGNSTRALGALLCAPLGAVVLLSGCVSVQHVPLAPGGAEALRGREVTIAAYEPPDFFAMTAARAAIGGLIGGAIMAEGGRNVVTNNNVQDPAPSIARAIGEEMMARHQWRLAEHTISVDTDEPAAIAKAHPGADVILELRTVGWGYSYYPTQWNRYRVLYSARLRLIDLKKAQVLAEGFCARPADEAADAAPTGDELLANGAQRLKQELGGAANFCVQHFRAATFALAGPSPTAIAAASTPAPAEAPRPAAAEARPAAPTSPIAATSGGVEIMFWESIRESTNAADFRAYLEQYPLGRFAALARNRLAALAAPATAAPAVPAAAGPPQAGDTWIYRLRQPKRVEGPKERRYVVTVKSASAGTIFDRYEVDGEAPAESEHSRGSYLSALAAPLFSPYLDALGPLSPATPLGTVQIRDAACSGQYVCEARARVVGRETLKLAAGSFDTVKVLVEHSWRPAQQGGHPAQAANFNGARQMTIWYAPVAKRAVKYSSRLTFGAYPPVDADFDLELVSYRLQ